MSEQKTGCDRSKRAGEKITGDEQWFKSVDELFVDARKENILSMSSAANGTTFWYTINNHLQNLPEYLVIINQPLTDELFKALASFAGTVRFHHANGAIFENVVSEFEWVGGRFYLAEVDPIVYVHVLRLPAAWLKNNNKPTRYVQLRLLDSSYDKGMILAHSTPVPDLSHVDIIGGENYDVH